jgi:outer membrane lipoprotein-sorting protein
MRKLVNKGMWFMLAGALALATSAIARKGKQPSGLPEILAQMNETGKTLKTVSANIDYTTVTVLVDDKSTQSGQVYFRKGKMPEICIKFQTPQRKVLLLKDGKGHIFLPNANQVQDFDLSQKSDMVQQFLLLGFGSDTNDLKKNYTIKYLQEVQLEGEMTAQLELTPLKSSVAAQITKIQLWVSEDAWMPVQQKFFEPSGDYLLAHYKNVVKNGPIQNSDFELGAPSNATHVRPGS